MAVQIPLSYRGFRKIWENFASAHFSLVVLESAFQIHPSSFILHPFLPILLPLEDKRFAFFGAQVVYLIDAGPKSGRGRFAEQKRCLFQHLLG